MRVRFGRPGRRLNRQRAELGCRLLGVWLRSVLGSSLLLCSRCRRLLCVAISVCTRLVRMSSFCCGGCCLCGLWRCRRSWVAGSFGRTSHHRRRCCLRTGARCGCSCCFCAAAGCTYGCYCCRCIPCGGLSCSDDRCAELFSNSRLRSCTAGRSAASVAIRLQPCLRLSRRATAVGTAAVCRCFYYRLADAAVRRC